MPEVNGVSNDNGSSIDTVFGLMNFQGKYLTAERFGNQISVTGTSLRSKQMWTFVQESEGGSKGYLRSPQNNYLETNKHGDVICDKEEKDEAFLLDIVVSDDGKWAFRDIFGKFLAGNSERLYTTMEQKANNESYWAIHLAAHPQVNLKSVSRKRYVHHQEEEMRCNEDIPWGHDAVITLEYTGGLYSLRCSNGSYLNAVNGEIVETRDEQCMLILSIHDNAFAFRASNGKYLTVYGPKGRLIATKTSVGKGNDELFLLEESKAQCVLLANNEKKVSHRQGIDLTANQFMEAEDTETFQIGYHLGDKNKVTFQGRDNKYWKVEGKGVKVNAVKMSPDTVFQLEWYDNKIAVKSNDKYLKITSGGTVQPIGESASDPTALFVLELVNRLILVLRGEHGYMGMAAGSNKILCNRGTHDAMQVTYVDGYYRLKAADGNFWCVNSDQALITGPEAEATMFIFELCGQSKMKLRVKDGKYLTGDHNGAIKATGEQDDKNTIWEY